MVVTRWSTLVAIAVGVAAVTDVGASIMVGRGVTIPDVGRLVAPIELVIAAVVFILGWSVRQFLHGNRPGLDPIRAAQTAMLAKASSYAGAIMVGWYGGLALHLISDATVPGNSARALVAGLAAGGALVLSVIGLVVEHFCRIPPPDDPDEVPDPAGA
jgi:hypothetical protein